MELSTWPWSRRQNIATHTFLAVMLAACATSDSPTQPGGPDLVASLRVTPVTPAPSTRSSSSMLAVSWSAPPAFVPVRYDVSVRDEVTGATSVIQATATSLTLSSLKAATRYRIGVTACVTSACDNPEVSATSETPQEIWQLQGVGGNIGGLTRIVADGNVKLHAVRYGAGAPAGYDGTIVLYYGPLQQNAKGLAVARALNIMANPLLNVRNFTSYAGSAGLIRPPTPALLVGDVATGQGVPMTSGVMRLFFEAPGRDARTRILYLDAQDGLIGSDFNRNASNICATQADYDTGGGCEPRVAIGVEGDATNGNARITNARQHKVGYPTQTDWRWDGEPGTFMVFTTGSVGGCSTFPMNHGYAVWSGSAWQVQYEGSGCPKLFRSVQAMHPLHIGGARYKMYYGNPSEQTGRIPSSNLPFLGPKMMLYADGARTGGANVVDFEDWESVEDARRVAFLWPDGSTLNSTALGYIDDFTVLAPTGDLQLQVMYVAITDGSMAPFAAVAILLNP